MATDHRQHLSLPLFRKSFDRFPGLPAPRVTITMPIIDDAVHSCLGQMKYYPQRYAIPDVSDQLLLVE